MFARRGRQMSTLAERAAQRVIKRMKPTIENNPNLWLGADAINEPTISILDPAPGYAELLSSSASNNQADPAVGNEPNVAIKHLHMPSNELTDPFYRVQDDLSDISSSIRSILTSDGSDHPVLSAVSSYFFEHDGGKKVRPAMVLLVSKAAEAHRKQTVSNDLPSEFSPEFATAAQLRLAEITEMIHTASLLHDDVIDEADTRRGVKSVNRVFGTKLSILAGDFLLARSSVSLARLRSLKTVELMSTAIEHLVKGEVMQMKDVDEDGDITFFEYYLRKNYYKTGSLMSNSCRAALVLGYHDDSVCDLGFAYGRHIGLAFQLIDDVLDYEGAQTGKPMLADLKAGLATAPVILAQEEYPVLRKLISRKFKEDGDIEQASELVEKSSGLERSRRLATAQAELACQAAMQFAPSTARDALVRLAQIVVERSK